MVKNQECTDAKCPIHGGLSTRGRGYTATVVSDKMDSTVVVELAYSKKIKKYDRYVRTKTTHSVHNPPCINAKKGDVVKIMECRKLSKTVSSTITEKISSEAQEEVSVKKSPKKTVKKKTVKKEELNG